jgi:hypothetical protein
MFKIGDKIRWTFNSTSSELFRGKTFEAEVAMVDVVEKHYGVYAVYGQDLIPFEAAKIVSVSNMKDIDPEYVDIVNNNFWKLF